MFCCHIAARAQGSRGRGRARGARGRGRSRGGRGSRGRGAAAAARAPEDDAPAPVEQPEIGVAGARRTRRRASRNPRGRPRNVEAAAAAAYNSDDAYEAAEADEETEDVDYEELEGTPAVVVMQPGLADEREDEVGEFDGGVVPFKELLFGDVDDADAVTTIASNSFAFDGAFIPGTPSIDTTNQTLLQLWFGLFPLETWLKIVAETNAYAYESLANNYYTHPRPWDHMTVGEFMVWIGLCYGMTLVTVRGSYKLYWSGKKMGAVQYPNYTQFMGIQRWETIKQYLHLRCNKARPPTTTREGKLWQCEWLEVHLNEKAQEMYHPAERMCGDERGLPCRHKYCPIRVYNPTKPNKFHIQIQSLVDSNGYIWHSWTYDRIKRVGLKLFVLEMQLESLPCRGFHLFYDRWYGSTNSCQQATIAHQNFTATTCNSYVPDGLKAFTKANTSHGDSHWQYAEEERVMVNVWKDRSLVPFVTNNLKPVGATVLRPVGDRYERQPVPCGQVTREYNKSKAYVDASDKRALGTGSLEVVITSHKWWHVLFFGLLDSTSVRLEVLATAAGLVSSRLDMIQKLHAALVENTLDSPVAGSTRTSRPTTDTEASNWSRFNETHTQGNHMERKANDAGIEFGEPFTKALRCVVCNADFFGQYVWVCKKQGQPKIREKKRAPRTIKWCVECKVHLCSGSCFKRYHSALIEHLDYGPIRQH